MGITLGAFLIGLSTQMSVHSKDEVNSIKKTDDGYEVTVVNKNGNTETFEVGAGIHEKFSLDTIDDEIALYSRMENIVYISLTASRLLISKKISSVPLPVLVTTIIQLAEDFDHEYGTEKVGENTVVAINQFAEAKLIEQFCQ